MTENAGSRDLLSGRKHFEILDGLRGLAALVVVIYHFMEIAETNYNKNFISHGYLAVDFFFCLSGFVVAYAYDHRIPGMKLSSFIKLRLIRLQPLVVIGSILGLITFLIDPYSNLYSVYGFGKTALLFITSVLLIPYPIVSERYFNLFNLNAPMWSLFWEYIANLLYATVLFKISKNALAILVAIAAAGIWYVGTHAGNVGGGWGGPNFWHGLARVSYSFLMGMLIYRFNWIIKNNFGLLGMSALLMLVFLFPYRDQWNWLTEPLIIIFYLPLLVALGAGASLSAKHQKINKISGDISYPLYMVHYPFVWIYLTYVAVEKPTMETKMWVMVISVILITIFSYLVFKYVDLPVRNYFTKRLKAKMAAKGETR